MPHKKLHFVVVDDSKLDCFIAEKIIRNTGISESIKSFLEAEKALDYIRNSSLPDDAHAIVLVDIQMPVMNGFGFVDAFERLPQQVKDKHTIYIISSSVNEGDLKKVQNYSSVLQFLNKPLSSNELSNLLANLLSKPSLTTH